MEESIKQRLRCAISAIIFGLMLLVEACNTSSRARTSGEQALNLYFEQELPKDQPGAAVLISRNDSVIFSDGYGIANLETNEPITTRCVRTPDNRAASRLNPDA